MGNVSNSSVPHTSAMGCLLRLVWMLVANAVIFFSAILIVKTRNPALSAFDILFAGGLIASVAARFADIRHFNGTTCTGEPATMLDWRRYAITMVFLMALIWGAAHGLAWCLGQ